MFALVFAPLLGAYVAAGPFPVSFQADISAFKRPQDLTQICLVAAAASGAAPATDPRKVVEWCATASAHLFNLYPKDTPK